MESSSTCGVCMPNIHTQPSREISVGKRLTLTLLPKDPKCQPRSTEAIDQAIIEFSFRLHVKHIKSTNEIYKLIKAFTWNITGVEWRK